MARRDKDTRPYFTVTNEYPRHRKVRHLSHVAFRLHIELMADCNDSKSDGFFSKLELNARGPKVGKELLDAGLIEDHGDGTYRLHDYLAHQNSKDEIAELQDNKKGAGAFGAHVRHHKNKGVFDISCDHCQKARAS